jgi:hypothetical protein
LALTVIPFPSAAAVRLRRMSAQFDELYVPPSRRPKRRRGAPNPDRAVAVGTRVSIADRDRLDYLARRRGLTTADLLRIALEPVLAEAREIAALSPLLANETHTEEERAAA